jgi:Uma2 family endonuclease
MSVTAASQRVGLTWEAFIELPEELLKHAELLDGEVHQMAAPGRPHQLALVNLIGAMFPWVQEHGGEMVTDTHVKIAARRGYQPDLAWYEPARVPDTGYYTLDERVVIGLQPDVASSERRDGDMIRGALLPGFEIAVADLIANAS